MKKGLLALAAGVLVLGPAGAAHAYEEALDVNETGIICLNFTTGDRIDEYVEWEWVGTPEEGFWNMTFTSCVEEGYEHVPEGWCLPDYPWESEEQEAGSRCDEIGGS